MSRDHHILTLNAGSSNLKCALFRQDGREPVLLGRRTFQGDEDASAGRVLDWCEGVRPGAGLAVGHRVVHGGPDFHGPTRINPEVIDALERLVPMAPLHQPHSIALIRAIAAARPDLKQAACFDTSFHRTMPEIATRFGLPREMHERGLRRYGFHGLSYEYVAARLRRFAPKVAAGRVIVAHLGSGASMCAMLGGRSIDSTMGFSPLDGLLMGTRPGALDPGVVLHLRDHEGFSAGGMETLLYHRSGLLGVSGLSADMRVLLASGTPHAREAIDLFVYRAAREAGALASSLGGLDALVFTGGIGENCAEIRAGIAARLHWLGIELDWQANEMNAEGQVGLADARASAWILPTDEEQVIGRQTMAALAGASTPA